MKNCSKCNFVKCLNDFTECQLKLNKGKCKQCVSDYNLQYSTINADKLCEYRKDNSDKIKTRSKKYKSENKEKIQEYNFKNKEHKKEYDLNYNVKNREKRRVSHRKAMRLKRDTDPCFKIKQSFSSKIGQALKTNFSNKNNETVLDYFPWVFSEFKKHIENHFLLLGNEWMSWENYGKYNRKTWIDNDKSTWVWNVDHIIPHSNFHYISMEDEEFKECWSLNNLRPYSAKQNIIDGCRRLKN